MEQGIRGIIFTTNLEENEEGTEWCYIFDKEKGEIVNTTHTFSEEIVELPMSIEGVTVESLGERVFQGVGTLRECILPKSIKRVGDRAFHGCRNLQRIQALGVEELGEDVFSNCSKLESVIFGKKPVEIGDYTFEGCDSLTSVRIGEIMVQVEKEYPFTLEKSKQGDFL